MKARKSIYLVLMCIFLIGSGFSTYKMLSEAEEFKLNRKKYTESVIFTEGVLDPVSWLPAGSWEEKLALADVFKNRSNRAHDSILRNGLITTSVAFSFLLFTCILFFGKIEIWRYVAVSLLVVSIVALVIGVSTPMMEMAAFNTDLTIPFNFAEVSNNLPAVSKDVLELLSFDVTFDGRMYYFYQSKSIMGLIKLLFVQGNYLVGSAILLFSLLLPVVKLACSFGQLLSPRVAKNRVVYFITNYLGKWSMADVFVVALFLGYFSFANMNVGIETQTEALFGLYCFGSYVVLSLLSTHFINTALKAEKRKHVEV